MNSSNPPQEIDLIDLAKKVWAARREIIKYGIIGGIVGLIISFSIPKEYKVIVKMAPERTAGTSSSSMSSLASMAGISPSQQSGSDAITATFYPEVVTSIPFLLELSQMSLDIPKIDTTLILFDYIKNYSKRPWWKYIPSLPSMGINMVRSLFTEKKPVNDTINPFHLTGLQEGICGVIGSKIDLQLDKKNNLITLSVEMQDPYVAALVADSTVSKLQKYVQTYRTEKANRDLQYNTQLHKEARERYHLAQAQDASYADAMRNISLESVRIERERLTNEKLLAFQIYTQATSRMELSRAKVQEETPCTAIIEPARVPNRESNKSVIIFIGAFAFLAGFFVVAKVISKQIFNSGAKEEAGTNVL